MMPRLLALLTIALVLAAGDAAGEPRLHARVVVDGAQITFGDLFADAGALADVAVGPAPAPGHQASYTVQQVAAVARAHGLGWRPTGAIDKVEVTRPGQPIGRDEILAVLRGALSNHGLGNDYNLELRERLPALYAPSGAEVTLSVERLSYERRTRRFEARLLAKADGWEEHVRLTGFAQRFLELPVLAQAVPAGGVIGPEDLKWIEVRADRLTRRGVTDPEQIIGLAARRSLRPGAPLRLGDFTPPIVVPKGKLVTMRLEMPGLSLSALGRALGDGAAGQPILVMNVQSKRTVQAIVVGPNQVRIPHQPRYALAAPGGTQ